MRSKPVRKYHWKVYLKHLWLHPWHVVVLAGATVFGIANWSLSVLGLVFIFSEILLHSIIWHLPAFVQFVNQCEGTKAHLANQCMEVLEAYRYADNACRVKEELAYFDERLENFEKNEYSIYRTVR